MSTAPYGSRRVEITSLARARMTAADKAEVNETCFSRGFRLNLMWSQRERAYMATLAVGGRVYEGVAADPMGAWRKALALRDSPLITMFDGPAA